MKQYIIGLLCVLILISVVSAEIRMVLDTPKVVFTSEVGETVYYFIKVTNKNNYTVFVNIHSPEIPIQFDNIPTFYLESNTSKRVNYSILINQTGDYEYSIPVTFEGNNESFTLSSQLLFSINETNTTEPLIELVQEQLEDSSAYSGSGNRGSNIVTTTSPNTTQVSQDTIPEDNLQLVSVQEPQIALTPELTTKLDKPDYIGYGLVAVIIITAIAYYIYRRIRNKKKKELLKEAQKNDPVLD